MIWQCLTSSYNIPGGGAAFETDTGIGNVRQRNAEAINYYFQKLLNFPLFLRNLLSILLYYLFVDASPVGVGHVDHLLLVN